MNERQLNCYINGEGFPILCLHGHPGSGRSMSVFTQHLSKRFKTFAPDLRGYGNSPANGSFAMSDHLSDLERLLDRFQVKDFLILGWSLGGILAMELALKQPERVKGLILLATAASPRSDHPPISWQDNFYTGLASIVNLVVPGWQWNIDNFGKRSLYRYLIRQHTPTAYQYLAQEAVWAYLKTSRAATNALYQAIAQGYDRLADIQQIQCPTLFLAGDSDYHISPHSSQETARHLPNCQWRSYPHTAHLFPWEVPNLVLKDIDRWLEENYKGGTGHGA
jgi:pimeloyl-ACP methyl ester carboxylesterase